MITRAGRRSRQEIPCGRAEDMTDMRSILISDECTAETKIACIGDGFSTALGGTPRKGAFCQTICILRGALEHRC